MSTSAALDLSPVSPGDHTVSEIGRGPPPGTPLSAFSSVIGGDCAADGIVNLAAGDQKTRTITNYDHWGGCSTGSLAASRAKTRKGVGAVSDNIKPAHEHH